QAPAEQRLADSKFTPATGIKIVLETNSLAELQRKLDAAIAGKSPSYDLVHYDYQWLGKLVTAHALEKLDAPDYFGENAHSSRRRAKVHALRNNRAHAGSQARVLSAVWRATDNRNARDRSLGTCRRWSRRACAATRPVNSFRARS